LHQLKGWIAEVIDDKPAIMQYVEYLFGGANVRSVLRYEFVSGNLIVTLGNGATEEQGAAVQHNLARKLFKMGVVHNDVVEELRRRFLEVCNASA
jgi:hypothetical protein